MEQPTVKWSLAFPPGLPQAVQARRISLLFPCRVSRRFLSLRFPTQPRPAFPQKRVGRGSLIQFGAASDNRLRARSWFVSKPSAAPSKR